MFKLEGVYSKGFLMLTLVFKPIAHTFLKLTFNIMFEKEILHVYSYMVMRNLLNAKLILL